MRKSIAAASIVMAVLAVAAPAWAQYPPQQPTCAVDDTTVTPGQEVTVSGENWRPNSAVEIRFRQDSSKTDARYGPFPTDSDGDFTASITVPQTAQDGPARIIVGGPNQAGRRVSCNINVTVVSGGGSGSSPAVCAVDDTTPAPGQTVKVSGRQWQERTTVDIAFVQDGESRHMATAEVNNAGRFAKQATIPADAEPGPAQIHVRGTDANGNEVTCVINITVTASSTASGFSVADPLTPGSLALLVGTVGMVAASRRRRARALVRSAR